MLCPIITFARRSRIPRGRVLQSACCVCDDCDTTRRQRWRWRSYIIIWYFGVLGYGTRAWLSVSAKPSPRCRACRYNAGNRLRSNRVKPTGERRAAPTSRVSVASAVHREQRLARREPIAGHDREGWSKINYSMIKP